MSRLAPPALALLLAACAHAAPAPGPVQPAPPPAPVTPPAPPSTPDAPFRQQAPPAGAAAAFQPPQPRAFKLENGLQVFLVERRGLPLVTVALALRSGTDRNPKGKPGLAAFVLEMLDQGSATRDGAAQARGFEDLGARFSTQADADASLAQVTTLTATLDAALELFADAVLHPAFRPADVERKRSELLGRIAQRLEDPGQVEDAVLRRAVFGDGHPWGFPAEGTRASVKAIGPADLAAWHRTHAVPGNAALTVVGDVDEAALRALLERRFGAWKGARPPPAAAPGLPAPGPVTVVLVDKPGAPQSQLGVGQLGVSSKAPDLLPSLAMDVVLGNSFDSRLNGNLRTAHGWSYGAFSYFEVHRQPGLHAAEAAVVAEKTAEAVAEVVAELVRMRSGDLTEAEVAAARDGLAGRLPSRFLTNEATAGALALRWAHELPDDWYPAYLARTRALGREELLAAARARILPERLVVVVVGPRALVEAPLRALGLGPVELRDAEGAPVPAAGAR